MHLVCEIKYVVSPLCLVLVCLCVFRLALMCKIALDITQMLNANLPLAFKLNIENFKICPFFNNNYLAKRKCNEENSFSLELFFPKMKKLNTSICQWIVYALPFYTKHFCNKINPGDKSSANLEKRNTIIKRSTLLKIYAATCLQNYANKIINL